MNNFDIYVKTSALGKTGIHWRKVESQDNQPAEVPELIRRKVAEENGLTVIVTVIVDDLLDPYKPSLLIFRDQQEGKLLLEITGIESPKRSMRYGRKVLNSIVFIADDQKDNQKDNEKVLRMIACKTLQDMLGEDKAISKLIEDAIDFYELEEFRVDLSKINQFIENIGKAESQSTNDQESKIEKRADESLKSLANELEKYSLPTKNGVLVVVTEMLEIKTILHEANVWRGFAINSEKKIVPIPVLPPPEPEAGTKVPPHPPSHRIHPVLIISLLILVMIAVIVIGLIMTHPKTLQLEKIQCQDQIQQPCSTPTLTPK